MTTICDDAEDPVTGDRISLAPAKGDETGGISLEAALCLDLMEIPQARGNRNRARHECVSGAGACCHARPPEVPSFAPAPLSPEICVQIEPAGRTEKLFSNVPDAEHSR